MSWRWSALEPRPARWRVSTLKGSERAAEGPESDETTGRIALEYSHNVYAYVSGTEHLAPRVGRPIKLGDCSGVTPG